MTTDTIGTTTVAKLPAPRDRLKPVYLIAGVAMLLLGAWTSLRYSFGVWGPDADIAAQVVIWQGVMRYGLAFIPSWSFTPDNWLLSLSPIMGLIFSVFGPRPAIVIGVGWLIFAASIAITAILANCIAGWRAAFATAIVLLFSNLASLGSTGFLSYPVSHNISMAWALVTLLLAYGTVAHESFIGAVLVGLCIFVNAVSDPWAGPGIALPIVLASLVLAGLNWRRRQGRYSGALCAAAALGFFAARTRLFGVMSFLPVSGFTITDADGLVGNVGWMFRAIATMFNIVPFADVDNAPAQIISFFSFAAVMVVAGFIAIRGLRGAAIGQQLVVGASILSIGGVSAALLLYKIDTPSEILGRFLPNLHYLGALLVGVVVALYWRLLRMLLRTTFIAYAALLVASGLASGPTLWTCQSREEILASKETKDINRLAAFLEQNKLTYGYGPYWGSEALAMNWMTKGRVTIRSVAFDMNAAEVNGYHPQTSRLFYLPQDQPAETPETFLIINDDGENCPAVDACEAMAIRQFGEPSRRLTFEDSIVLVWPHPIVSGITDY